jgi:type IV pilus assembly protein PilE
MHIKKFSKGFSLVELMIVVAVIAILAAVAIPAYHNHILRTRQADAHHNLLDIKAAQEMFHSQYNFYADLTDGTTFTNLLSFDIDDSTYYVYDITAADTFDFTAEADGQNNTKFENNLIRITDETDPAEISEAVGFKFSLLFQ